MTAYSPPDISTTADQLEVGDIVAFGNTSYAVTSIAATDSAALRINTRHTGYGHVRSFTWLPGRKVDRLSTCDSRAARRKADAERETKRALGIMILAQANAIAWASL